MRKTGGEDEAQRNQRREDDGNREEVAATENRENDEHECKGPRGEAKEREVLRGEAAELPGQDRREEKKHADVESCSSIEIPEGAIEALHVEVDGMHGGDERVHSPKRIGRAKAKGVPDGKEEKENGSDSIEQRGFQDWPPKRERRQ